MRAELWAVLTALCWGTGSLLEKRGVHLGGLTPVMGTVIRTGVSLGLLLLLSIPYWGQVKTAGVKSIALIAVGGGLLAGCLGVMFLYTALKTGHLSTVLPIAFCLAPVVGAVLGLVFLREQLNAPQVLGVVFCVLGAALVTTFR